MISEIIIKKSIDNAIGKCSQTLTLNGKIVATFDKFHDETCGKKIRKTEKGIVTDSNGNIIHEKNGNKSEVPFNLKDLQDLYEEHGDIYVTHNHPREGERVVAETLSSGDISFLFNTYRPYGKRPDGSEGYLVGEEGVYYIKSITEESANGSRMTLVRGDNFNHDNEYKAKELGGRLGEYWDNYYHDYYELNLKTMDKYNPNDFSSFDEYFAKVHDDVIKQIGVFEKNKEFKDIQNAFRDIDCKLSFSFPREYVVD